ncbi:MAG: phenylacetate--CoA ligase family protein [Pedosphaera sp.]|nr:phenylacetate--CoA ligase family protein [Pedosphaera sp.]
MAHPLERIYPYVPVAVQNLGISLYGLAWRQERLGGDFEAYVKDFRTRERWTAERMQSYVERELRRTMLHAYNEVPYYQRVWKAEGITRRDVERITLAELAKFPVTPKEHLRAEPDAFIAKNISRWRKLKRYHSSGSTGTPITSVCTAGDHRRFIAAREARSFRWAGSTVRAPRAMIGGRLIVPKGNARPPFHRYNWAEHQVYFSAYHISPAHVADYVRAFNRYQPYLLTGYANSYYLLARMMCEQNITLDYEPDAIVLCSEKLTPEMKHVIEKAFRARAYEEYGAVENCVLATECEHGNLHVNPDFGVMEIIDSEGHPVSAEQEGSIVCTSLLNATQPLIRYEIGDVGIWSAKNCPCGRDSFPVLKELVGRLEDVVIGPDGRELVRFHGIFIDMPTVLQGQVIQETIDQFTVKVVAQGGFGNDDEQLIRRRFAERLGPVNVRIEIVSEIPRTERGKFRAVISKLSPGMRNEVKTQWQRMSLAS